MTALIDRNIHRMIDRLLFNIEIDSLSAVFHESRRTSSSNDHCGLHYQQFIHNIFKLGYYDFEAFLGHPDGRLSFFNVGEYYSQGSQIEAFEIYEGILIIPIEQGTQKCTCLVLNCSCIQLAFKFLIIFAQSIGDLLLDYSLAFGVYLIFEAFFKLSEDSLEDNFRGRRFSV